MTYRDHSLDAAEERPATREELPVAEGVTGFLVVWAFIVLVLLALS